RTSTKKCLCRFRFILPADVTSHEIFTISLVQQKLKGRKKNTNMSSAIITVRLSGGPSRQRFTLFGQSLTQGQLTQMLSQIPRLAIRKTNPGGFDYIIIPDEAVS